MSAELEFIGMDEILKWAEETGEKVRSVIDPVLKAAAEPILSEMQHTTAFKDQKDKKLRSSLKIGMVMHKGGVYSVKIGDTDGKAPYSWFLERGTSRMAARPFMRPAFERKKDEAYQIMREKIKEGIG